MIQNTHSEPESPQIIQHNVLLLALQHWHRDSSAQEALSGLYLFQALQRCEGDSNRYTVNAILQQGLEKLAVENAELELVLRYRYLDGKPVLEVANHLNIAESTVYNKQNEAVAQLTRILLEMESEARQEHCRQLLDALEFQPNTNLINIETYIAILSEKLAAHDAPAIIAIEGIGGIGKTTLADVLARDAIVNDVSWEQVAWITARQTELYMSGMIGEIDGPALTAEALFEQLYEQLLPDVPRPASFDNEQVKNRLSHHLTSHKCLVVIDNLETVEDVEALILTLRPLTNPTKFILTSRKSLYSARDVFHFQVPELSEPEAIRLIRNEAESSNLPHVVAAADEELQPIYKTVGGNPLALHLVVGQLHIHDLREILEDLVEARTETAENLYTFIYRRAWDRLNEAARRALIAMLLTTPCGDSIDELLATCDLKRSDLRNALKQLVTLNLVNSLGGLNDRRYSIHNLTRTFLHKQVVMWA